MSRFLVNNFCTFYSNFEWNPSYQIYFFIFQVITSYDLWKFLLVTIISLVLNQTWIAVYMMVICAHPGIAHRICPMVSAAGGFAGGFIIPRPQMPPG